MDREREFQIFVKPVGSMCNLQCSYCYYSGKNPLSPETKSRRMDDSLLEEYIIQHMEATTGPAVFFSWHGGEPTLAGLDFYRKAVLFQKNHLPAGKTLLNGIQTNGILLNDAWCRFFADEGFLVGISIDGPPEMHNLYRIDRQGKGSFNQVLKGYQLLQKYHVTTEILCVLNAINVQYPLEIYRFFKGLGARFLTFLPLVEQQHDSPTGVTPESVPAEAFGWFLVRIFNEWVEHDIGKLKIQIFEEALRTAFNQEHTLCLFKENCGGVPVVEHNGDFYSCDHFTDKKHFLGNIRDHHLIDFLDSPRQKDFGKRKSSTLPAYCTECPVKDMCNGECPRNRFLQTPDGEAGLNYLCRGYKLFFTHCRPFVETVRAAWQNNGK